MYNYQEQRKNVFTEQGQLLDVRPCRELGFERWFSRHGRTSFVRYHFSFI